MARSRSQGVDLGVYRRLAEFEAAFAQLRITLYDLEASHLFERAAVARFARLIDEARAAASSYLLEVLEEVETREAGRMFRKRMREERKQE